MKLTFFFIIFSFFSLLVPLTCHKVEGDIISNKISAFLPNEADMLIIDIDHHNPKDLKVSVGYERKFSNQQDIDLHTERCDLPPTDNVCT
ncbi:MAG: hypothetical protein ACTSPV_16955, partial [Candidatus Hodarchaeales archaeon]